jgi:hypothetical protein
MASKSRLSSVDVAVPPLPLSGSPCQCLAEFFREEFARHHRVLQQQREYFSDRAIEQAEDALRRIMGQIEHLCQRDDACEVIGQLLRRLDLVTNLSAWSEPRTLH